MIWLIDEKRIRRFRLGDGCFIKATHKSKVVFGWRSLTDVKALGSDLIESAATQLNEESDQVQLKLILPSVHKLKVDKKLSSSKNIEFVFRDDVDSEIVFDPQTGRAGIEKQAKVLDSSTPNRKIKVLIVEDSKTVRNLLKKTFAKDPMIEVIAGLESAEEAVEFLAKNKVDVLTLDINLPGMDGAELLKKIYPVYKTPTILITSLTLGQSSKVFEALEAGAIDYIQKPEFSHLEEQGQMIIEKIKVAHSANISEAARTRLSVSSGKELRFSPDTMILVGSSTGGTNALAAILDHMPKEIPPILIVQHIPPLFSKSFADRLNQTLPFKVKEAEDGDRVVPNQVLVAPGGLQMRLDKHGRGEYKVSIVDDPPVNRFKPSVDYFFDSAAKVVDVPLIATILTGMGKDGAQGLLELKNRGFATIAQDKESSVVYGMPRAAAEIGAAQYIVSLESVARKWSELSLKLSARQKGA